MSAALKMVLMGYESLSASERRQFLLEKALCPRGGGFSPSVENCLIRRRQVARKLGCSLRMVDALASTGILQRVRLPGRSRAAGFRLADVENLIGGIPNALD